MNYLLRIGLLIFFIAVGSHVILGCSCFLLPLENDFKDADAVFLGRVSRPFDYDSNRFKRWQIEVLRVWKGGLEQTTELISDRPDDQPMLSYCMPEFPSGKTFMFFVKKAENGIFKTIPCSWTFASSKWDSFLNRNIEDKTFWKRQGKGIKPRKK